MVDKYEETLLRAGRKLNFAKNSLKGANNSIRDDDGYQMTCRRIAASLENFMNCGFSNGHYGLNEAILEGWKRNMNFSRRNFSSTDLQTVQDVDVVDISIAATIASHGLTYIAMERPMESVRQEISFQGLKALNDVNGYQRGDVVFDPRIAIDPGLNLGQSSGAEKSTVTLVLNDAIPAALDVATNGSFAGNTALQSPVILGTTKLRVHTFSDAANATEIESFDIAFDPKANSVPASGIVPLVLVKGGLLDSGSVNIEDGSVALKLIGSLITLTSDATPVVDKSATGAAIAAALTSTTTVKGVTIEIITCVDRVAESNGAHTLKLTPFVDSKTLVTEENRIVLQSSVEVQAQMNKILRKNAQYGIDTDFGKRAIDQIIALYTYYIDTNIVKQLWYGLEAAGAAAAPAATMDLSGFGNNGNWGYNANVKNDAIGLFTNDLCQSLLVATGQPVTALIVDDVAARMYASDKESFVPDPAFLQRRDGFIGTYQGIPVVRNYWLHGKAGQAQGSGGAVAVDQGVVIGVFKSPDGQAAPVAFGDYLPPYSTLPAVNPQNPGELAQALFSSTACKCVVPGWAVVGTIIPYSR